MRNKGEEMEDCLTPLSSSLRKVYREDNSIYFYDDCDVETAYVLEKHMRAIYQDRKNTNINIVIDSQGGHLCGMYDFIKAFPLSVFGWVRGYCCSAATTLLLGCEKRYMSPTSFLLIHGFHGYSGDDNNEGVIRDEHDNTIKQNNVLRTLYKKETKIPHKELEELIKNRDRFLLANECKKWGIIDDIATFTGV
jgi:ATP-dependent protease ClpP protease subunit